MVDNPLLFYAVLGVLFVLARRTRRYERMLPWIRAFPERIV